MATRPESDIPFDGYRRSGRGRPDELLVRVGPGTPGGEYLRRYWQPVQLARDVGCRPRLVRILGEDLVLFRDGGGRLGLVHRHCPHRRASLEFAMPQRRGIRCCYHGWLFDVDGAVLEVPGQPEGVEQRMRAAVRLGAYPVREHLGLIFAYLGPPQLQPAFPIYDTWQMAGHDMVPYAAPFACNWLQVQDAILDPLHTAFLHSRMSREQFSHGFGEVGELAFYQRRLSFLGVASRRVGDNIWVRVNELVLPNYTQAGAAFAADGTRQRYFGRTAFARWVVPVDDQRTTCFAWAIFGPRGDPPAFNTPEGPELIEQGERFQRPYEERQRHPADLEACEGMGAITAHDREHLVPSDKGIVMYRRQLRRLMRALEEGREPEHAAEIWPGGAVPTYGGDTVLRIARAPDDDRALLRRTGAAAMAACFAAEELSGDERDRRTIAALKALEAAPP